MVKPWRLIVPLVVTLSVAPRALSSTLTVGDVLAAGYNNNWPPVSAEVGVVHAGVYSILHDYASEPNSLPSGIAISPAGVIYVSEWQRVAIFDSSGQRIGTLLPGFWPAVAFDETGNIYLSGVGNVVRKVDATGTTIAVFTATSEPDITDIDLAADQCTLYLTTGNRRIQRYDVCTSTRLADFPSEVQDTLGRIRILLDGSLIAGGEQAVYHISQDGRLLKRYSPPTNHSYSAGGLSIGVDPNTVWIDFFLVDIASGQILQNIRSRIPPIYSTAVVGGVRAATSSLPVPLFSPVMLVVLISGIMVIALLRVR